MLLWFEQTCFLTHDLFSQHSLQNFTLACVDYCVAHVYTHRTTSAHFVPTSAAGSTFMISSAGLDFKRNEDKQIRTSSGNIIYHWRGL